MRWCTNCVLPDTRPNLVIGSDSICNACKTHRARGDIDWRARREAFRAVVANAKDRSRGGYDCIIPVSGGKDSTWQVAVCLEHGLRPLCVTWRPPARTVLGDQNLRNLIRLGVDHIDYSIDPEVERLFARKAFERLGDPAIPMHMAIFAIPLAIAARFSIPLIVWGENPAFEYGGTEEESRGFKMDQHWLKTFGVTHGTTWRDWSDDALTPQRLTAYAAPTPEELDGAGILAVFLGYYLEWDPEVTRRVAEEHGFQASADGPVTGLYNYADLDDEFIAVHHWLKWYKFGFTRLFDNLSLEIRNGRIGRDEAIKIIRRRGDDTPHGAIAQLCDFLKMTESEFFTVAERFRNGAIWANADGVWHMPDFLIPDWNWSKRHAD